MNDLLQNLLKLQALDFTDPPPKNAAAQAAAIRALIPDPILGHYDRLVVRGKKGVAIVRNQVCTGCHMRLPIGTINTLMQGQDIQLCDTCGRYLSLEIQVEAQPAEPAPVVAEVEPAPAPPAKAARKPRKRKAVAHAA
jgi:hypothetical protein